MDDKAEKELVAEAEKTEAEGKEAEGEDSKVSLEGHNRDSLRWPFCMLVSGFLIGIMLHAEKNG